MQSEQQRRIVPKFDDDENREIDAHIKELVISMTTKVRQCEDNIKKLNKISFNSNIESGIKDNIQINLVDKLRTFTMNFRKNEETYMRNYKELVGDKLDDDDNILDIPIPGINIPSE